MGIICRAVLASLVLDTLQSGLCFATVAPLKLQCGRYRDLEVTSSARLTPV